MTSSDEPPPKRTRPGEKPRTGTCAFADRIARVACERYAELVASSSYPSERVPTRTVLAAFVAYDRITDTARVISLGVGTKTIARDVAITGHEILDAHAEVLARRGLKKFFFESLRRKDSTDDDGIVDVTDDGVMRVRENISLHLYVSSAPCGNACVRRWAKGKSTERRRESLGERGTPSEPHVKLQRSACDAGQVALCVKIVKSSKDDALPEDVQRMCDRGELAPGTAPVGSALGVSLTCSDKLCVWNVVGYQGALLRAFMPETLRVASITVGRKFSEPHLCRAMCCRVDGFKSSDGAFVARHPALMETAVVFDDVPMDAEEGATFDNPFAMVWCAHDDDAKVEILDGKTGTSSADGAPSSTCKAALFDAYNRAKGGSVAYTHDAYARAKRDADNGAYNAAKDELFNHPKMFEPRRGYAGWRESKRERTSGYARRRRLDDD